MAEGEGFEPSIPFWGIHTFQACAFNHSATPPFGALLGNARNFEGGNLTDRPPRGNADPFRRRQILPRRRLGTPSRARIVLVEG